MYLKDDVEIDFDSFNKLIKRYSTNNNIMLIMNTCYSAMWRFEAYLDFLLKNKRLNSNIRLTRKLNISFILINGKDQIEEIYDSPNYLFSSI